MREYQHGSRWAVWRWKLIYGDYLRRLHLIHTPFGSICVHWFGRPDPERHLHDHPVNILSIILHGHYTEELPGRKFRTRRWFNWIPCSKRHRIVSMKPGLVTLCFMGPRRREWGFYTETGFIPWQQYTTGVSGQ